MITLGTSVKNHTQDFRKTITPEFGKKNHTRDFRKKNDTREFSLKLFKLRKLRVGYQILHITTLLSPGLSNIRKRRTTFWRLILPS